MTENHDRTNDETEVRQLVERWASAVRRKDLAGILADHSPDVLMFDVPPPLQSRGIAAYQATWNTFFAWSRDPVVFDLAEMSVTASREVAFVTASARCAGADGRPDSGELNFRLTIGLRKLGDRWMVLHEHHSIPASP